MNIPGVVGEPVWQELADEARVYLELHERLSNEPLDSPEREALEDKIVNTLSHLAVHSQILYASIDEAVEALPLDEIENENLAHESLEETTEADAQDALNAGMTAQKSLVDFWSCWKKTTDEHTRQIETKRKELEKILSSNKNQNKKEKQITQVLDNTANTIEQHTKDISTKLPDYRRNLGKYIEANSKFVFWLSATNHNYNKGKQELYSVLIDFRETLEQLTESVSEYIESVQSTGRSAFDNLNHVKLGNACENLVNKLVGILDTVRELHAFNTYLLEKLKAKT